MTQHASPALIAGLTTALIFTTPVVAQTPSVVASTMDTANRADRAGTASPRAEAAALAADALARAVRARADRDALAMLVAATELRRANLEAVSVPPPAPSERRTLVEGLLAVQQQILERQLTVGSTSAAAAPSPPAAVPAPETLFAEARTLAAGDRALIARIDRTLRTQSRGLTERVPAFARALQPGERFEWRVTATGGASWTVSAVGDGAADVDIGIFDERGRPVCADQGVSHVATCTLTPRWTGAFTVLIANVGRAPTQAVVVSN